MKILLLTEYFPHSSDCEVRGGIEARAFYVARELARRHQVTVLCARLPDEPVEQEISGIMVRRCGPVRPYAQAGSKIARAGFVRASIGVGREIAADLVDGYHYLSYLAAIHIGHARDIPRIATFHDMWRGDWIKNFGLASGIIGEVTERYVLAHRWDRFIANSEATRQKLLPVTNGTPVQVVYNGISVEDLASIRAPGFDRPTICYVGRLVRYKRVDDLLRALLVVREHVPDIQLKIVGSGPDSELFKALTVQLGLGNHVEFLGFVQKHRDVLEVMARSRVLCLPSAVEGFGMVIIEAMACGTPVVASSLAPIREITHEGKGSLLFPCGEVDELAAKLTALVTDDALHARCVVQARALASEYDWKPLAAKIERIYEAVLS